MATEWFEDDGYGVAISKEDPGLMIIGDYIPDWVRLPKALGPPHAGQQLKVTGTQYRRCPTCKKYVRYLVLEDRWVIVQCKPGCGFLVCKDNQYD